MKRSIFVDNVQVVQGDLLKSGMQTLVNTVSTVGVMGKGVALAFKRRYPEMYDDYVRRCDAHEVKLGRLYPYRAGDRLIVNFPTKEHGGR
jgi:O-acetyl-ADP-ribose deacetylase (regulator of RNase III)